MSFSSLVEKGATCQKSIVITKIKNLVRWVVAYQDDDKQAR